MTELFAAAKAVALAFTVAMVVTLLTLLLAAAL